MTARSRTNEFLRHFRDACRISTDALYELESREGLGFLGEDLESLALGRTRRRFSMAPLGRFRLARGELDGA